MLIFLAACLGAFLPALFFAVVIYALDRYEQEPWYLVLSAFVWGAVIAVIFALISQLLVVLVLAAVTGGEESLALEIFQASGVAPVTEEIFKGVAVLLLALVLRREFDSLADGIVYGAMVGFGFAATENVLYLLGAGFEEGLFGLAVLFFLRVIVFGLNHAFFTSLTGIGVAAGRLARRGSVRLLAPLAGLAAAIGFHAVHNLGATLTQRSLAFLGMSLVADWTGILGVFALLLIALSAERRWMRRYLEDEVAGGTLSAEQYARALSARRRSTAVLAALGRGDLAGWHRAQRFYRLCSELAQKKYQCAELGDPYEADVERLRQELVALSSQVG
jgi:RsiW-degrading membrane proteinase PrsW (M82 family)